MWNQETLQKLQQKNILQDFSLANTWSLSQLNHFLDQEFPLRKQEEWKYINFNSLKQQTFALPGENIAAIDITPYQIADANQVVFINGQWSQSLTKLIDDNQHCIITSIKDAVANDQFFSLLEKSQLGQNSFASLNAALMSDGLFVYVPSNIELLHPIHLLYLNTPNEQPHMNHPRHLIYMDRAAKAMIVEQYVGVGEAVYFNNVVTHLCIKAQAQLTHYKTQHESEQAFHIANILIDQQQHSRVETVHVALGGQLDREDLQYNLRAEGAECRALGFNFAKQQQILDTHSRIQHDASYTRSQQTYKTIAQDKAHSIFNGKMIVAAHTQRVYAEQSNPNLLLSSTAEIDTKPELQIYADDVRCSHGASIGELDEEALFYMKSRGIAYEQAVEILIKAFADEIIGEIRHEEIRQMLRLQVEEYLQ